MGRTPPKLRNSKESVSDTVESYVRYVIRTWSLEKSVLVLACMPFLVGPPLLALALVGREALRGLRAFQWANWATAVMIAIVNVILSVLVLQQLGGELLVLIKQISFWFQDVGPALDRTPAITNV